MTGNFQWRRLQLWEGKEEWHHHRVQHDQPRVLTSNVSLHGDERIPPNAGPTIWVYHTALLCPLLVKFPLLYVAIEF
jgi:hypothetical protein